MGSRAILLSLIFLLSGIIQPSALVSPASAGQVTHFGNSGFPPSVNISFAGAGYDSTTNLTMGANALVSTASFDVRGWPDTGGNSPTTIGIDVGDDGDLEWAFGGSGNGSFGHVNEFSNGWHSVGVNLSTGSNSTYSIRLPLNAVVSSASLDVSTLSQLTLSGNDVEDATLRKPNPTWGNATHLNCNYGNSSLLWVGKTEWSNWNIYRSAYWFNLTQLPAVTVLDANLSFWIDDGVNNANSGQTVTANHTYRVHPLLKDWIEGMENGAPVQQGPGVTWNNAIDNVTGADYAWTTSGASHATDRGSAIANVTDSPANLEQNWLEFNSSGLTNLIQGWVNGTIPNQGLLLVGDENTNKPDGSRLSIPSSENSTHGPRLTIVFEGTDDVTGALDVGNDGSSEWSHAGNLSNGTSTPDFSAVLNTLLANATPSFTDSWGNEFVDIPLNITGNATLVLSDLDVLYDWNPTISSTPQGDIATEINQHLSNLTANATGNVSISINVSSGSAGIVEISNLLINTGNRPPSIGSFILPTDTIVPDGQSHVVGIEVTCYQGLGNLSWVALTPQLQNSATKPVLFYSLSNSSTWMNNPGGLVANLTGHWQPLNTDTALMKWNLSVDWIWPVEEDVVWLAQVGTVDTLNSERLSSEVTNHERRVEIASFNLWDETSPSEGGPEIFHNEWVAGGDQLRASGTVRFLNLSSFPQPGELSVELENVTGNGTTGQNGEFSINTTAPTENHYDGYTISAMISGNLDATEPGFAVRVFRVDATAAGLQTHAPLGVRVIPDSSQLFNVSIADTIGLDDSTLNLRWWAESIHDDGDGIPQAGEYATSPLLRQSGTDYFHAIFDDSSNVQGQEVSLFVEGNDLAGNTFDGGEPGIGLDLIHYTSLVPSATTLDNASLEMPGGIALVPDNTAWLNVTLHEENWIEDIEMIVVDFGQGTAFTWTADSGTPMESNDAEVQIESFSLSGEDEELFMNLSFSVTPYFDPTFDQGQFMIRATDSSGIAILATGMSWYLDADIYLSEFSISLVDDNMTQLVNDSYVTLGARLLISGQVSYVAADLAPPSFSTVVTIQVPLDLPLVVTIDENGYFSGTMDALGSGLYQVNLEVSVGPGEVTPAPAPLRIQVDEIAPSLVGSEPAFIAANTTNLTLQLNIQEMGSGLSTDDLLVTCQIRRGLSLNGEQIQTNATMQSSGQVSSYLANLSLTSTSSDDSLDCWLEVADTAGNNISGLGSTSSWPLSIPVVETRPDIIATEITISPNELTLGQDAFINFTIINIGNQSNEMFWISLETKIDHDGQTLYEEVDRKATMFAWGDVSTSISFTWDPDWLGELELIIRVDSNDTLEERDENNSYSIPVSVKPAPDNSGIFSSQVSMVFGGGAALLLLIAVMLFVLKQRDDEDEYDDWEDEKEDHFEDEDITTLTDQTPDSDAQEEISSWRGEDGYQWRELSDGSNQWWDEEGQCWTTYEE